MKPDELLLREIIEEEHRARLRRGIRSAILPSLLLWAVIIGSIWLLAGCTVYQGQPTLRAELAQHGTCDLQCKRLSYEAMLDGARQSSAVQVLP